MAITIPVLQVASGLDVFTFFNGVLTDPFSINYEITEPSGALVGSGVGFQISIGHYDARNSVIPSGYSTIDLWTIEWTFISSASGSSSFTEDFFVTNTIDAEFTEPTDPENHLNTILEFVEEDLGITITASSLETLIKKALHRINRKLSLTGDALLVYDSNTKLISPTPNDVLLDIILLQVECLMVKKERIRVVGGGLRIRDGDTELDISDAFNGFRDIVNDTCGELDKAIKQYLFNKISDNGEIVWYHNQKHIVDTRQGNRRSFRSPFDPDKGDFGDDVYFDRSTDQ